MNAFEILIEQAKAEGFEYVDICSDHSTAFMSKDGPTDQIIRLIGKRTDGVHQYEDTLSHINNAYIPWMHRV